MIGPVPYDMRKGSRTAEVHCDESRPDEGNRNAERLDLQAGPCLVCSGCCAPSACASSVSLAVCVWDEEDTCVYLPYHRRAPYHQQCLGSAWLTALQGCVHKSVVLTV